MSNPFQERRPYIGGNQQIRTPQREAYEALVGYAGDKEEPEREVGIVLPVGCGKSGCITLTPFAFKSNRTLVVAPGISIANQLDEDFDPSNNNMFYQKCNVLTNGPYPEPVKIRGNTSNRTDLDEAHVVITNIQQLQGDSNRWLNSLPADYFDLILFDEGHHSVAESWETLRLRFPAARIVNFSATPLRADGQRMAGRIIYSYPIFRAIREGYVKRLKALQLNPRTLRYVRSEDGQEIEVGLDEVRQLGEEDAKFRRSILTSTETLNTIVDASIRELDQLRTETGDNRLKIIASALNYDHCRQIVEAYCTRNRRADYVHSRENTAANQRVIQKLENHQLDVIVQVRKLGEGFDHPFLSVAAVFSVFSNLSPFVQFVGRIMRVIKQNNPGHILNRGVVVFHTGANIARQWGDFQQYSEADQDYFDQLLPIEGIDPNDQQSEREVEPTPRIIVNGIEIRGQSDIQLEEIPLLQDNEEAALRLLQQRFMVTLKPVPTTKARERQAKRASLDTRVKTEAARILNERGINPEGRELDRKQFKNSNLVVMKAAIDRHVNTYVRHIKGERHEFSALELEQIDKNFSAIVESAIKEVFNAKD